MRTNRLEFVRNRSLLGVAWGASSCGKQVEPLPRPPALDYTWKALV